MKHFTNGLILMLAGAAAIAIPSAMIISQMQTQINTLQNQNAKIVTEANQLQMKLRIAGAAAHSCSNTEFAF